MSLEQTALLRKTAASPKKTDLFFTLLMVLSMVIWGGSWVSAKAVANMLSPEQLCFWRFLLSALSFIPLFFVLKIPVTLTRKSAKHSVFGAFFISAYMFYFFRGLEHGLAGAAGVLVTSLMPLMTLLFAVVLLKRKIRRRDVFGLAIGMTGAAVLLRLWTLDPDALLQGGNLYFVLCSALWALVTISSQKAATDISPYLFSFITYGLATLFFLPSALSQGLGNISDQGAVFWLNLGFLSIVSSTFATTIHFIAADRLGSYRTSSYVFIVPSSALLLSWLFLGEAPEAATILGGAISITAVYVINRRSSPAADQGISA